MHHLVIVIVTAIFLLSTVPAHCQTLAAIPIRGEADLMRAIESRHKEQIEHQYREYLSNSPVKLDIADMEIETRVPTSKDDPGSYDINVYYVDPTEKGSGDRLLQVALHGAVLAHRFTDAEIGTITAIPVFPYSREMEKKRVRGIVVINYYLQNKKDLFSRIADGKLKDEDMIEMNTWMRAWKEVRLDPQYDVSIRFK